MSTNADKHKSVTTDRYVSVRVADGGLIRLGIHEESGRTSQAILLDDETADELSKSIYTKAEESRSRSRYRVSQRVGTNPSWVVSYQAPGQYKEVAVFFGEGAEGHAHQHAAERNGESN